MVLLTANNQRLVNYLGAIPLNLATSVFAVGTTTVYRLDSNGNVLSWQNGRASNLNTMTTVPAFGNFQLNPSANITISDALYTVDAAPISPVAYFFGDSITVGVGAFNASFRWSSLCASMLGLNEQNRGISGTVLQNTNPVLTDNGRDRFATAITPVDTSTRVFILYGLNDLRYNGAEFSVVNYKNDLTEIVDGLIASGVVPSNITLGSPPYILLTAYSNFTPFNAGSLTKHEQYRDAVAEVAFAKGCKFADVFSLMANMGDSSKLISFDTIHPNNWGHRIIATAMSTAGVLTVAPTPSSDGNVLLLDASDATTITLTNSDVTQWRDKSGRTNHFNAPAIANAPDLITGGGKDGKNVIRFNGTTDHLIGRIAGISRRDFSFFIAAKSNDTARQAGIFCHDAEGDTGGNHALQQLSGLFQYFNNGAVLSTTLTIPTAWFVFSVTSTSTDTTCRLIVSGSTTNATTTVLTNALLPSRIFIGRFHELTSASFFASMDVGEIRLFKGAVSSGDRTTIETEMSTKWV